MNCLKTDIIIIGAGCAGSVAAINAAEHGASVMVLSKGSLGKSGITPLGFTGYAAVTGNDPLDSVDLHFKDTINAGRNINDQNLVRILVDDSKRSYENLVKWGVKFEEEDGKLLLRSNPGISRPRLLRITGGGAHLSSKLTIQMKKYKNIQALPDTIATELILQDGEVLGVYVANLRTGEMVCVEAKATILATGGAGYLWRTNDCPPESVGDGYVLAYLAGAQLVDMEHQLFYPSVVIWPPPVKGLEISYEGFLRTGNEIVNGLGERFINVDKELLTRDELTKLIAKEIYEGRGTEHGGVMIDLRSAEGEIKEYVKRFLPAFNRLKSFGIDINEKPLEVAPGAHTTLGGVYIDEDGRTNVGRLFACGEVAGNVQGANRLPGHAWLDCVVFGMRVGAGVGMQVRNMELKPLDKKRSRQISGKNLGSSGPSEYRAYRLCDRVRDIMSAHVGPCRDKKGLDEAISSLTALAEEWLPKLSGLEPLGSYDMEFIDRIHARNLLIVAQLVAKSALLREESRGTHYRLDYPHTDENWLKHTLVYKQPGVSFFPETGTRPIKTFSH